MSSAETEGEMWNDIYDGKLPKEARVVRLSPNSTEVDACLCMPYLIPIDRKQRKKALDDGSIRTCLQDFASRGYHHREVQWRHLGFFGKCVTEAEVYLCDLGSLEKHNGKSDEDWEKLTSEWIQFDG